MIGFKHFLFSPLCGEEEPIFDDHIFQMGWFNHQLVMIRIISHTIHVWRIYLHEWLIFYGFHVGKYTSPMDDMRYGQTYITPIGDPYGINVTTVATRHL